MNSQEKPALLVIIGVSALVVLAGLVLPANQALTESVVALAAELQLISCTLGATPTTSSAPINVAQDLLLPLG